MFGYTARQLVRYYRHCIANPDGHVLPPGGRAGWDDMTAQQWLRWFRECLMKKAMRGTESTGKGNRSTTKDKAGTVPAEWPTAVAVREYPESKIAI